MFQRRGGQYVDPEKRSRVLEGRRFLWWELRALVLLRCLGVLLACCSRAGVRGEFPSL